MLNTHFFLLLFYSRVNFTVYTLHPSLHNSTISKFDVNIFKKKCSKKIILHGNLIEETIRLYHRHKHTKENLVSHKLTVVMCIAMLFLMSDCYQNIKDIGNAKLASLRRIMKICLYLYCCI